LIETPWSVAILDFAFPDTREQRPADFETTLKFGIALTQLAAEDPDVHKLTAEVQNLLRPRTYIAITLAWISTEPDSPNMCVAKGFTRLTNFGRAIRPIGALIRAHRSATSPTRTLEIPRNVKT